MDNKLRKITLIIIASLAIIASLISIGSLAISPTFSQSLRALPNSSTRYMRYQRTRSLSTGSTQ